MTVKTYLCAALAAIALALPVNAVAAERIPFHLADGGLVEVIAGINGGTPQPLLVDLGAGVDVLAADAARHLNVVPDGHYTSFRMSGERVDLDTASLASIVLGSYTITHPTVGVWDGLNGSGIAGLISATAFQTTPVTFDYAQQQLTIEDAASLGDRVKTATRVPLILQEDRGIALGIFARFDFGHGQSGICEIDTGSQGFFVNERFAKALGIDVRDARYRHKLKNGSERVVAPIPSLALSGAPHTAIEHPQAIFADLIYDCNVGNDFWSGRSFTLDIPDRAIYV